MEWLADISKIVTLLNETLAYLEKNKEWIFSGAGLFVMSGFLSLCGWWFLRKSKSKHRENSNQSIQIDGSNNQVNQAGGNLQIGLSGDEINQIVQTLLSKHQTDLQNKDEQIKALTTAIQDLSTGNVVGSRAQIDAALEALKNGNTELAKQRFIDTAQQGEQHAQQTAEAYRNIGALTFNENTQQSLDAYRRATQLDPDNPDGWNQLGHLFRRIGELDNAIHAYNQVLKLGETHDDKEDISIAYGNLGIVYKTRGDLDKAIEFHEKSLKLSEELESKEGIAQDYGNLGVVYKTRGDLDKAIEFHEKALAIDESMGNKQGMAEDYGGLGNVYRTKGDLDKAIEFHEKALKLNEELGSKEINASIYSNLGNVYRTKGDLEKAIEFHEKALKINEELGRKEGIAINYANLGNVYEEKGDKERARGYWEKSVALYKQMGSPTEKQVQSWIDNLEN
jgi:protein O-GlcNAc transferase